MHSVLQAVKQTRSPQSDYAINQRSYQISLQPAGLSDWLQVFIYFKGLLICLKKPLKSILIVTCNSTCKVPSTVEQNTNIYYQTCAHYGSLRQESIKINFYVSYIFFPPQCSSHSVYYPVTNTGHCFVFILFCWK